MSQNHHIAPGAIAAQALLVAVSLTLLAAMVPIHLLRRLCPWPPHCDPEKEKSR